MVMLLALGVMSVTWMSVVALGIVIAVAPLSIPSLAPMT
jgi:hypothetical protein